MSLLVIIKLAFFSIKANIVRTIITCLIIGIGIMALVGILTAVDGLKGYLSSSFSSMGANSFKIRNRNLSFTLDSDDEVAPKVFRSITYNEAEELKEKMGTTYPASVQYIANQASTLKFENKKTNPNILILGSDENYLNNEGYSLVGGRNFTETELYLGSNVVMLGYSTAKKLFGTQFSLRDKFVRIDDVKFQVIGVLNEKGSSIITTDNVAVVPLLKAKQLYPQNNPSYVVSIKANDPEALAKAEEVAIVNMRMVRRLRPGEENNFDILKSDSISGMFVEKMSYATIGGAIIAAITLLGASIGLMNIMLVSVTERTKEIGTLKALGARKKDIQTQFLVEAIVICILGGVLGVILGIVFGNIASLSTGGTFIMPWAWMLVGIAVCIFVGMISGIYPAIKASKLDPIEALRYE